MIAVMQLGLILAVGLGLAYFRSSAKIWTPVLGVLLLTLLFFGEISAWLMLPLIAVFIAVAIVVWHHEFRITSLVEPALTSLKATMPSISKTEQEALDAGDTWWEADLLQGNPDWQKLLSMPPYSLSAEEQAFLDNQCLTLNQMLDDYDIVNQRLDLPEEVWQYLKKEKFFGLCLPKEYGGLGFSAAAHSAIVIKIATRSLTTAVTVMVPNALGPGELLHYYGTDEQKNYYLPRLADGRDIPCFALTGTHAGSDAGAMTDTGVVCKGQYQGKTVTGIRLNWNKRYITLAPVATVLGLAFKLSDPEHLLGEKEDLGITLCLIPTDHPGVEVGKRHYPMHMAFMNGPTRGKDVFIPLEWVIGGPECVGQGWRMLMECLSMGRGISIPALGAAVGSFSLRMSSAYARIREQFSRPIGHFEGVENVLARIAGYSYIIEAGRRLTAASIDQGVRPSVASAIAKYHLSELGRTAINDAMDIHAGKGVQMGPSNYIAAAYEAIPVSITVEGANILTRNLIIFGQGAIRCHPYLREEIALLEQVGSEEAPADLAQQFDGVVMKHIGFVAQQFAKTFTLGLSGGLLASASGPKAVRGYLRQMMRMSSAIAFVTDVTLLLLGGDLKRRENLSARLGDVLSHLYLGSAVVKYYSDHGCQADDLACVAWSLSHCLQQIQIAFDDFFSNFPVKGVGRVLRFIVFPWGRAYRAPSDKLAHKMARQLQQPSPFRDRLTEHCFIPMQADDPVGVVEMAMHHLCDIEPIAKRLREAIKMGAIDKTLPQEQQLDAACEAGIITKAEADQVIAAEQLRFAALSVDEFLPEELTKRNETECKIKKTKEVV